MLENLCHANSAFVTLTYAPEFLPMRGDKPTLVPKDLQDWLKRYRAVIAPLKVRFYAVGEYGEDDVERKLWGRPHYHVLLFGGVVSEELVSKTWGKGLVHVGTVTADSAGYVAGYTVKKMTAKDDPRLHSRHPEFCRMSLRPGIGAAAMHDFASELMRYGLDESRVDVPTSLTHGKRNLPLGRYLRMKLRELVGKDAKAPLEAIEAFKSEMLPLYNDWWDLTKDASYKKSFSQYLSELDDQRVLNIEARNAVFKERKSL